MYDPKEDAKYFGDDVWVYCRSHMAPHLTGWCTVGNDHKCRLHASNYATAVEQCRTLGLPLYRDNL